MDLESLATTEEGKKMELLHPTTGEALMFVNEADEEQAMFLVIKGSDSSIYKKSQRKIVDRRLKQQSKFRSMKLNAAKLEEEALFTLADCTSDGRVFVDKKVLVITPGSVALGLYKRFPWIREQATEFMEDRTNFLAG